MKYFVGVVSAIVLAVVVVAFVVIGSPNDERMRRFDTERVSDLQTIQYRLVDYWQAKDMLPADLSMLRDDLRGVDVPVDPETGEAYRYEVLSEESFRLCAVFNTSSADNQPKPLYREPLFVGSRAPFVGEDNWDHAAGEVCFERTIDPDFFESTDNTVN